MSNTQTIITPERARPAYGAMFNIDELKRANRDSGSHFFDADTMRFFRSRVLPTVIGGRFFVTSEQRGFDASDGRGYSVREFMPDGSIETLDEFNAYASSRAATSAARRATKDTHAYYYEGQHGANGRKLTYVVTDCVDPWQGLERLHKNFRVFHLGRARDYMLTGDAANHYPKVSAR